ncbi:hypothetical protein L484_019047 [Morus notabilis]|uniref:Bifunctional inhibitor/plant lipid transfer protein/seed storage helical domain-containing protein n=1 Tax=Morus notabilis TaxID=981085 RepID=W9QU70_9ROSA|nr:hypothetical protein L484_019047 [Morus notabilis]
MHGSSLGFIQLLVALALALTQSQGHVPALGAVGAAGGGTPSPGTGTGARCPRDALKIGVCANVLGGLVNATVGNPPVTPCCTLIQGLADLEAALCLCTAIRASILGININIPVNLSLLLNVCSRNSPPGFQCP